MREFDKLYFEFEARFRGSRELIRQRLQVYRPLVEQTLQIAPRRTAIDYGSGRGEWLELLNELGWSARGVDLNEDMVSSSRGLGLTVDHEDALAHSSRLENSATGLVSAFHLVEHLPIEQAFTLARNAYRALCESGMFILETPNPENLMVGTCWFYMDPTHVRPLPPELLRFLVECAGFSIALIARLNGELPPPAEKSTFASALRHSITSGPDYAVIGIKSPKPEQRELLEQFVREIGQRRPTDLSQAEELDIRWAAMERRLGELDAASTTSNVGIAALRDSHDDVKQQVSDLQNGLKRLLDVEDELKQHLLDFGRLKDSSTVKIEELELSRRILEEQMRWVSEELTAAKAKSDAILASTSWKITAPLRWLARVLLGRP